ncbi:hypothetical protein ACIQNI_28395 [Streptomyces sp. NPDC091266]|uniref:hypothetical protein n=1 Tax=Streptomyces sp. NPDC091266 TaxID=3365978 RepID=UPI0037F5A8E6
MEDAIPADELDVGRITKKNQIALFSNPFNEGREEALVLARDGKPTWVYRDSDTSSTGWRQKEIDGAPLSEEIVVAVLPGGSVWALCVPVSRDIDWAFLRLEKITVDDYDIYHWVRQYNIDTFGAPRASLGLYLNYSPNGGPTVTALAQQGGNKYTAAFWSPTLPAGDEEESWLPWQVPFTLSDSPGDLVGGGYVSEISRSNDPHYVMYLRGAKGELRRIDFQGKSASVGQPGQAGAAFCGTWNVPALLQEQQRSDVGWVALIGGTLEFWYQIHGVAATQVCVDRVVTGFVSASVWQDANGLLHTYGIDAGNNLKVLHQKDWALAESTGLTTPGPRWVTAVSEEGKKTTVMIGLHGNVSFFQLDPFPDYVPSELIKMQKTLPAEAFCACTQDMATNIWVTEAIRLPQAPATQKQHIVNHYSADAVLLDTQGAAMPDHPVVISADSLTEIKVATLSYQVGPGREVLVRTNALGKLSITMDAYGLTPAIVHVHTDGLEAGAMIDFASPLNNYLAGTSTLPSQKGPLSEAALTDAHTVNVQGEKKLLVEDWSKSPLKQKDVFFNCRAAYALAAGEEPPPAPVEEGEGKDVVGWATQKWDPSRPSVVYFHTQGELDAFRAELTSHSQYGGWWDHPLDWAGDLWEGIKSGATEVGGFLIDKAKRALTLVIKIGDALIELADMVIDTVQHAAQAMEAMFQYIAEAATRAVDWLKSLFALSDIWDTKEALASGFDTNLTYLSQTAEHFSYITSGWFTQQKDRVSKQIADLKEQYKTTRYGDFGNMVPPETAPSGVELQQDQLSTPQANWFMNRATSEGIPLNGIGEQMLAGEDPLVEKLENFLNLADTSTETLRTWFTGNSDFFLAPFADAPPKTGEKSTMETLLDFIEKALDKILDALNGIADDLCDFTTTAVTSLRDMLTKPLGSPKSTLDMLYQWVWDQARPGHPYKQITLGDLLFLAQGFFVTTTWKLAMGVDTETPFKGGKFPSMPKPPWGTGTSATPVDPNVCIQIQAIGGLVTSITGAITTTLGDIWVPWREIVKDNPVDKYGVYAINFFSFLSSSLAFSLSNPSFTGDSFWADNLGVATWGIDGTLLAFDAALSTIGMLLPFMKRSSLLRNSGHEVDEKATIYVGSALHLLLGVVKATLKGISLADSEKKINETRWAMGVAGTVISTIPDFLQFGRAVARYVLDKKPESKASEEAIFAISAIDGVLAFLGGLIGCIPPFIEWTHKPSIDPGTPKYAYRDQNYSWFVPAVVGQSGINKRPDKAYYKFEWDKKDGYFVGNVTTGEITAKPLNKSAASEYKVKVTVEDGFGPPLSAGPMEYTITVDPPPES